MTAPAQKNYEFVMSKINQVPPNVAGMISNLLNKQMSVWSRDNVATVLEAIVEESEKAIKSFRTEREKAIRRKA